MDEAALPPKAYVNASPNMYLNKDKETIADLKDRIEELAKSNYELAQENRKIKEESFELARTLENRLETVSKENRRLDSEKVEQLRQWREESTQMQIHYENLLAQAQALHKQKIDEMQLAIDSLDSELKGLESYKNSKQKTDEELELLRKKYDDLHTEFTLQKNYLNKEHMLEIEKINKRAAEKQKQIADVALIEASKALTKAEIEIHEDKKKLESLLNMQKDELDRMKRKNKRRKNKIRELKRERELSQQNIAEYSAKHYEQTRVVETLKDKIKLLDATITKISGEAEREKEQLLLESTQKIGDLEAEVINLKQQVKLRSKENKHLRALSQMILDQRSEVEQFFLEALDQIKEEIRKKMVLEQKTTKLPVIRGKQKMYADRVDLSDLNWEDRERVLRILFAKMNVGGTNTSWREPEQGSGSQL